MLPTSSLKYVLLLFYCTFSFNLLTTPGCALNIGAETTGVAVSVSKECSKQCESSFCSVPPLLRYGKYCGLLYSGCPDEKPCDGLDACCMKHDQCVQAKNISESIGSDSLKMNQSVHLLLQAYGLEIREDGEDDYLSQECSQALINCMNNFKNSRAPTFKGNTCNVNDVIEVIHVVMEAALLAGGILHKP
ncbi:hypothetical protein V8G54_011448 [Vigna mungo]|uniref:phospholipase A2 n=1 Tax=Vigna mungo TaxID=3915 RepID=A0AAQ3NSA6_VIGMU